MRKGQVRGYLLDCEHTVWFQSQFAPSPGDTVFCTRCDNYAQFPKHDVRGSYYPVGDWTAYPSGRVITGVCHKDDCNTEMTGPFTRVRSFFEKHERMGCATEQLTHIISVIDLPPNSPPPF